MDSDTSARLAMSSAVCWEDLMNERENILIFFFELYLIYCYFYISIFCVWVYGYMGVRIILIYCVEMEMEMEINKKRVKKCCLPEVGFEPTPSGL